MYQQQEEQKEIKRDKAKYKLLRGFKDTLPEDEKYWQFVLQAIRQVARDYDYGLVNTPTIEESALFERTSGESSDVVAKELFRFKLPKGEEEEGGLEVALRPEGTAPVMRTYIEHGMLNKPQPVKLWYLMSMFRYDKPQAGRYRQHWQWGFEIIGESNPITDAQVIIAMYNVYKILGLDVVISVNSIGDKDCRKVYIEALREYYDPKTRNLCSNCRKRLKINPLRMLDCKEQACQAMIEDAPQIVDFLDEESRNHFVSVLEYLDELEIPYALDSRLVRGLDYYSRTTFEVFLKSDQESAGKLNAIGGGGRYDGLSESLGGRPTPAVGAAAGIERVILALKERNINVPPIKKYDIFIAQLGPEARRKSLKLFERLKESGWQVAESLSKDGLSPQLERANKLGVQFTLILGQKEILDDTIIVRDMSSGIQEEVVYEKIETELQKKVKSVKVIIQNDQPSKDSEETENSESSILDKDISQENNLNDMDIDNGKEVAEERN